MGVACNPSCVQTPVMTSAALTRRTSVTDLVLDLDAPQTARQLVELLLPHWAVESTRTQQDAVLVASELVAELVLAGGTATDLARLGLELDPDNLRVWVSECAADHPYPQQRRASSRLAVVERVASAWGSDAGPDGRPRTYADLAVAGTAA